MQGERLGQIRTTENCRWVISFLSSFLRDSNSQLNRDHHSLLGLRAHIHELINFKNPLVSSPYFCGVPALLSHGPVQCPRGRQSPVTGWQWPGPGLAAVAGHVEVVQSPRALACRGRCEAWAGWSPWLMAPSRLPEPGQRPRPPRQEDRAIHFIMIHPQWLLVAARHGGSHSRWGREPERRPSLD